MPAAEDYGVLSKFAEEFLGLEGDEKDSFVNSSMQRRGYKPVQSWTDPDPDDGGNGKGGDFFSSKKSARESRSTGGSNWQYGS